MGPCVAAERCKTVAAILPRPYDFYGFRSERKSIGVGRSSYAATSLSKRRPECIKSAPAREVPPSARRISAVSIFRFPTTSLTSSRPVTFPPQSEHEAPDRSPAPLDWTCRDVSHNDAVLIGFLASFSNHLLQGKLRHPGGFRMPWAEPPRHASHPVRRPRVRLPTARLGAVLT
jgi:hypothetical protein